VTQDDRQPKVGPTRVPRRLFVICAAVIAASALWTFRPLEHPRVEVPSIESQPHKREQVRLAALDLDPFRAPIWVAEPPPPPAPPPPAPPPPLRLQLLAIARDGETVRAVFYDPDADRVLEVEPGQSLGEGRTVERVGRGSVDVRDGELLRTLALEGVGRRSP
jgi:hypothetical protein